MNQLRDKTGRFMPKDGQQLITFTCTTKKPMTKRIVKPRAPSKQPAIEPPVLDEYGLRPGVLAKFYKQVMRWLVVFYLLGLATGATAYWVLREYADGHAIEQAYQNGVRAGAAQKLQLTTP